MEVSCDLQYSRDHLYKTHLHATFFCIRLLFGLKELTESDYIYSLVSRLYADRIILTSNTYFVAICV